MTTHIWLRAEEKPLEERTALTPQIARALIDKGFIVTVEKSDQSAIKPEAFAEVGCHLADVGSWVDTPSDTIILGLKELPESDAPLVHRHIHFAHVYKNQAGWEDVLRRFKAGGGTLYDLEYLVGENGRRVAAFGYWAGYTGAAVALMNWAGQQLGHDPVVAPLSSYYSRQALLEDLQSQIALAIQVTGTKPEVLVVGALGRSGSGAVELLRATGVGVSEWDLPETRKGGPFPEMLQFDILINCVFVLDAIPPFLTNDMLASESSSLSVICDVSCDPYGEYNPLPIYSQCTTFEHPVLRLIERDKPLDLISIDHLPSMLPVEASEDFCEQLSPHLLQLDDMSRGVWAGARQVFISKSLDL